MSERPTHVGSDAEGEELALDRDLVASLRGPADAPAGLDALFGELEQQVRAERGLHAYLRARPTPERVALAGLGAVAVALVTAAGFLRPDYAHYPAARMGAVLAVALGALAVSLPLALRPVQRAGAPGWALPLCGGLGALGLLAVYLMPELPSLGGSHAHAAAGLAGDLQRAVPCLGLGLAVAVLMYGLWSLLDRGGPQRGLAAAVVGGLTANVALQLHCPITAQAHLVAGHLGVLLAMLGVTLLLRKLGR